MTANKALSSIVSTLENRINIYNSIQIPALEAIKATAAKFDGKVLNRRFTAAATKALEGNENRVSVNFSVKYDGTTEYDILSITYRYNGNYGEFRLYPDRMQIKDFTDETGRLVAEKLITTCNKYISVVEENVNTDKEGIARASEFVARVEDIKKQIDDLNKDFPLCLRARVGGDFDYRK